MTYKTYAVCFKDQISYQKALFVLYWFITRWSFFVQIIEINVCCAPQNVILNSDFDWFLLLIITLKLVSTFSVAHRNINFPLGTSLLFLCDTQS